MLRVLFLLLLVVLFAGWSSATSTDFRRRQGGRRARGDPAHRLLGQHEARHGRQSAFGRAGRSALASSRASRPTTHHAGPRRRPAGGAAQPIQHRHEGHPAKIEGVQLGSSRANLFAALSQLFGPDAPKAHQPAVFLFTDCQANSWKEARDQGLDSCCPMGRRSPSSTSGRRRRRTNLAVVGDAPRRNRVHRRPARRCCAAHRQLPPRADAELTLGVLHRRQGGRQPAGRRHARQSETSTIVYTPHRGGPRRGPVRGQPASTPDASPTTTASSSRSTCSRR